jgi:serine/threonine protein kinase|eukprot:COSAG01_NODE_13993_length_1510_cov_1.141035_2_plen_88_part_00
MRPPVRARPSPLPPVLLHRRLFFSHVSEPSTSQEIRTLESLNQRWDPDGTHHIVRLLESFQYRQHVCLVFERLGCNLYELLGIVNGA